MTLAFLEAQANDKARLSKAFDTLDILVTPKTLKDVITDLGDVTMLSGFVVSRIGKDELDQLPKLQFIATRTTGFDHIDVAECARRSIVISNVPTYGENTVAEHAFALILTLSRKIYSAYERTERGSFDRTGLQGFDLRGKTLGVVGCGVIGKYSVQIGLGFGMKVVVFDVKPDQAFLQQMGCTLADSLDDLLRVSDVITLHVPYMPATHHLINSENIKLIKPGAILVNTARGGLVDTQALLWALENNIVAGAGLDVLEEENNTFDHVALLSEDFNRGIDLAAILGNHLLIARDDVVITPHNGFNSREAVDRIFKATVENIAAWLAGAPQNVVSVQE